jgi:nucleotide-binding universal stress UspA family protein
MHQIFISYKESDRRLANEIAQGLEAAGYTTWNYDRDGRIGFNYMEYCGELIAQCQAMVLLISPQSIQSGQVTREVMRASEEDKHILPVLCGISYEQFQKSAPAWRQALAGIAGIEVPAEGIAGILPRLTRALTNMGIDAVAAARPVPEPAVQAPTIADRKMSALRVMLLYKRNAQPDDEVLSYVEAELTKQGVSVFIDRHLKPGMEWAREIEKRIRASDVVIPLLSAASIQSEMLGLEVEIAKEAAQQNEGKPYLVPVRISFEGNLPDPIGPILDPIQYAMWKSPADNRGLVAELLHVLKNLPPPRARKVETGDSHGAVPLDSKYYITRPSDEELRNAIARRDSIILIKGPRQMGKTSLLARGLQQAREAGAKVVLTDFQKLNAADLQSVASFFRSLAELVADQLDLDVPPDSAWTGERTGNVNLTFERFIRREVLRKLQQPLVWGMDEVDRLFSCDFATEVFGLFRSWHNARSLEPDGPWGSLTMTIVHATEPHLFIQDLNQSPFNVGTKIALQDFMPEQVGELNRRYNSPLKNAEQLNRYYQLVGGNPFLVRRGLQELSKPAATLETFEKSADRDEGPFGDHLRRMLVLLAKDAELSAAVRSVLEGHAKMSRDSFFRLRSAGVMAGDSAEEARMRCRLYAIYLGRQLL